MVESTLAAESPVAPGPPDATCVTGPSVASPSRRGCSGMGVCSARVDRISTPRSRSGLGNSSPAATLQGRTAMVEQAQVGQLLLEVLRGRVFQGVSDFVEEQIREPLAGPM